jgi:hypothetical protein
MKKIIVVVQYHAYVPEDMTVDQLQSNIEKYVEDNFEDFSVSAKGYHNESESEPMFQFEDLAVGTNCMIAVGGN